MGPAESRRAGPVPSKGPRLKAVLPQAHSVCCATLAPECTFGRLRTMILPPACVRLLSRNFSKMHCFRVSELTPPEPGERGVRGLGGALGWGPARSEARCALLQAKGTTAWTGAPPSPALPKMCWRQSPVRAL